LKRKTAFGICVAFIFSLVLSLTGCISILRADYLKKHKEFLEYSLGDFTVIDKGSDSRTGTAWKTVYRYWTLQYKNENNENDTFYFTNSGSFESDVLRKADSLATEEIWAEIEGAFPSLEGWDAAISYDVRSENIDDIAKETAHIKRVTYFGDYDHGADILDTQNGIKLSAVTARELAERWGFALKFDIEMVLNDGQRFAEVHKKFIPMFRHAAEYLNCESVPFGFMVWGKMENGMYLIDGRYNKTTDSIQWNTDQAKRFIADYYSEVMEGKMIQQFAGDLNLEYPTPFWTKNEYNPDIIKSDADVDLAMGNWVTPRELVRDWGCVFRFDANVRTDDKEKLKAMARYFADYYEQDIVRVIFEIPENGRLWGSYNRVTDSIEWNEAE